MTTKKKAMTAEQFKALRIKLGLTQADAARVLGYGHANRVSAIELGQKGITKTLERLMRAYEAGYRPADWPASAEEEAA